MSPAVFLPCPVLCPLIYFAALLVLLAATVPTVQGSALLKPMHDGNALGVVPGDSVHGIVPGDSLFEQRWDDPAPGTKAFAGFQQRGTIDLTRRDCLPNGTNFCFGDSVNFCASCGTCCVDGIYCCGAGGICCGTGCCASGQTCDSGKCVSSSAPITVTAISYQTVTRTVTQIATVVVVVVDTSTIVRETEITVSNEQTQTNIIWVTETVLARRALPTAAVYFLAKREEDDAPLPRRWWVSAWRAAWGSVTPRSEQPQLHDAPAAAPLQRRQATRAPGTPEPVPTVTKFVTETVETTRVISETITTQTTSVVLTTVTRTNTKVLNARTTIDVTSILTITNHEPVTQVITTTESPVRLAPTTLPPRTSASATSIPTTVPIAIKSSSLQTPAIVGISIGGIAAAAIIAAIVIFWLRYRRKRDQNDNPNADLPPNVNDLDMMREPAYPALKHFVSQRTAAHHSAQFHPPAGGMAGLAAAAGVIYNDSDDPNKSSGGSSPMTPDPRASSIYSSAYNTPGAGKPRDRVSAMTAVSGYGTAEVPASEWTDDGIDRTNSVSPAVSSGAAAGRNSRQELDSTPVMEMGPGGAEPPLIPPRLRPTQPGGLHVVNGDPTYDGASWGDPNSPGLQSATLVGRALGSPPAPGPGPLR